jgi:hypothetical protein
MLGLHAIVCLAIMLASLALWRNAAVQTARQLLFDIRNQMFDFWAENHFSFNDPAYACLRGMINNSIRFAHSLAPSRFALSYVWYVYLRNRHGFQLPDLSLRFEAALKQVKDQAIAAKLRDYQKSMLRTMGMLMVLGSLSGLFMLLGFIAYFGVALLLKGSKNFVSSLKTSLDNEATLAGAKAQTFAYITEKEFQQEAAAA